MPHRRILMSAVLALVTAAPVFGQNGDLRSILKTNSQDTRPLADASVPSPPEPKPAAVTKSAILGSPILDSPLLTDLPDEPELVATPAPIQSVQPRSIPQPTTSPAMASQSAVVQSGSNPSTSVSNLDASKPLPSTGVALFDLGIAMDPANDGLLVKGVFVGSPAQRYGIKSGDKIASVSGVRVSNADDVANLLNVHDASQDLLVNVVRRGTQQFIRVRLTDAQGSLNKTPSIVVPQNEVPIASVKPSTSLILSPPQPVATPVNTTPRSFVQPASAQQVITRQANPTVSSIVKPRVTANAAPVNRALVSRAPIADSPSVVTRQPGASPRSVFPAQSFRPMSQPAVTQSTVPPQPRPNATVTPAARPSSFQPARIANQRYVGQTQVRTVPAGQVIRAQSPQGYPRPGTPARPIVGQGGRLIGNGRLINSAARLLPGNW